MKKLFLTLLTISLFLLPQTSFSQDDLPTLCKIGDTPTMTVGSGDDLRNALSGARAGDTILVQSGSYSGDYTLSASGTANSPITITSNTGVVFNDSVFTLAGNYAVIEGMIFDNGMVTVTGDRNRVTRNTFRNGEEGYNSSKLHSAVNLEGNASYNRVDHNLVKDWMRRAIRNTKTKPDTWGNRVDHNHLLDMLGDTGNSGEAFQVGTGHNDVANSPGTVYEYNLVENFSLEAEMVSLKSNMNVLRYNTFINAPGAVIASRTGSLNMFKNNTLINVKMFNIYGDNNSMIGNRLVNSNINIRSGDCLVTEIIDPNSQYAGCHPTARNTIAVGNQFFEGGYIRIGQKGTGKKEWPERNFPAENTTFGLNGGVRIEEEGLGAVGTKHVTTWEGDIGTPVQLSADEVGRSPNDVFCQVIPPDPEPDPIPDIVSDCEVIDVQGTVMGFDATGNEVRLPSEWYNAVEIVRAKEGNRLSVYEWYASTEPFFAVEGTSTVMDPIEQIKKVKCEALVVEPPPDPDPEPEPEPEPYPNPAPVRSVIVEISLDTSLTDEEVVNEINTLDLDITKITIQKEFKGKGRNK